MAMFLRLALSLAGLSVRDMAQRAARASILMVIAMIFVMIGLAGFTGALWILLVRLTDPVVGALLIGGFGFLMAAVLMLMARTQMQMRRQASLDKPLKQAEQAVNDFMGKADSSTVLGSLGVAALVGFLLAGRK